ncbi:jg21000 [Pararge aegeria aegeria]|uniref:Jg21000 protein n=1 Tax=Pararge aegeria aegeria TaxID=348720 RepID=A0A8S4R6W6_9NEOP|nr:jg21000 [Pararge aegeria aegeria]
METVTGAYNTVFYERADHRVKDWLLMTSPWPLVSIIASYLAIIKLLPHIMLDRTAYDLRTVIKWYNVLQIVSNAVVTWGRRKTKEEMDNPSNPCERESCSKSNGYRVDY